MQLPSADPLAGTSSRERICARLFAAGLRERQLYGKGRLFRDCLARPIMTAEVIATERHHRLQKAGSLLVENPLRNEPNRADALSVSGFLTPGASRAWPRTRLIDQVFVRPRAARRRTEDGQGPGRIHAWRVVRKVDFGTRWPVLRLLQQDCSNGSDVQHSWEAEFGIGVVVAAAHTVAKPAALPAEG